MKKPIHPRYKNADRIPITTDFYLDEFVCKDSKGSFIYKRYGNFVKMVEILQYTRDALNVMKGVFNLKGLDEVALTINSAYRTWEHHLKTYAEINQLRRKLGKKTVKVTTKSRHLFNDAVDVTYSNRKLRTKFNLELLAKVMKYCGFPAADPHPIKKHVHGDFGRARKVY